jgi:L-alanine-DL-glutamate epimerase-like enolase superfamily enzyme
MVLVELEAGGAWGLGYSYAHESTASLTRDLLRREVVDRDAFDIERVWGRLVRAERNLGRVGQGARAVSAIDTALWDLKAKLLGVPLATLFGRAREEAPVYGSGGFTSYTEGKLAEQLTGWAEEGIPRVKMKLGLGVERDLERVAHVAALLGRRARLFVDANEAYEPREALALAEGLVRFGVDWFEQPIQAENLAGMRFLRERFPRSLRLTTGEYLSDAARFRETLLAGAADVLQPDVTRCRGYTGFLKAAALCESFHVPVSSHCAPYLHLPVACAVPNLLHAEYFFDHVRVENLLFADLPRPARGGLAPQLDRPGHGLELKKADAEKFVA